MRQPIGLFALVTGTLFLTACQTPKEGGQTSATATADSAALATAADSIRSLDARWVKMVADKDTTGIVGVYAHDGRIMPPGAPAAVGPEAIRKVWAHNLALPSLTFGPDVIQLARSGDVAYDIGHVEAEVPAAAGKTEKAAGKYVVVWVKRNGQWKVMADIFNFDQ